MTPHVETENSPPVTTLVSGIINDAQELIRQQLTLFQVELKNDLRRTKEATIPLVIGGVVCLLAGVILCFMLAHLLEWGFRPDLPLWGAFGIVGLVLAIAGGALVFWGKSKFDAFNPLPDKSVEALKENIQWKTKM